MIVGPGYGIGALICITDDITYHTAIKSIHSACIGYDTGVSCAFSIWSTNQDLCACAVYGYAGTKRRIDINNRTSDFTDILPVSTAQGGLYQYHGAQDWQG